MTVLPILSSAVISLRAQRGPLLAWRVLPALTVAAAMRASAVVVAPQRGSHTISPPHAPCSPSASAVA